MKKFMFILMIIFAFISSWFAAEGIYYVLIFIHPANNIIDWSERIGLHFILIVILLWIVFTSRWNEEKKYKYTHNLTATTQVFKEGEDLSYYLDCNNCDVGGIPMWYNPERMTADGSCIMCGNKVSIKLIPPGHVVKWTVDGESIVPK